MLNIIKNKNHFLLISGLIINIISLFLISSCEKDNSPAPISKFFFNSDLSYGTVSDIEGNVYKTIQIGSQVWMAENLKTTKYNDGKLITSLTNNVGWGNLSTGAYCWHKNDIINKATYGALYNGYAVRTGRLCPTGWHVPANEEWHTLILNYDPEALSTGILNSPTGGTLKETGTIHWSNPDTGATNLSGFTALPGDLRDAKGIFGQKGYYAYFWSATWSSQTGPRNLWCFWLSFNSELIGWGGGYITCGQSIRCVKD